MEWLPSLPGSASDTEVQNAALAQQEAEQFLASTDSVCEKAETVQLALRLKYGSDIFKRFWQKIAEKQMAAISAGAPLLKFNKYETIAALSEATGEDVLPLYKRWKGFSNEGPVDPLVLTMQLNE